MAQEGTARARVRWSALHPLLFAAYPVLFLYQSNLDEAEAGDVAMPLLVALAGTAVLLGLASVVLRNLARAALVTTVIVALFFSYGYAWQIAGDRIGREALFLTAWGIAGLVAIAFAARASARLATATKTLNAIGAVLVVTSLVSIGFNTVSGGRAPASAAETSVEGSARGAKRDIVYLVFDRYAGEQTLRETYRYDNRPFLDSLWKRGFYVADDSRANHMVTNLSLAASLNMRHIDELRDGPQNRWAPANALMREHEVGRFLKRQGYRYVHIGNYWEPTRSSPLADVTYTYDPLSEFSRVLLETTILRAAGAVSGSEAPTRREAHRGVVDFQFDKIEEAARMPGPTFVFAHILLPHYPYVFDRDGSLVTAEQEKRWGQRRSYVEQLIYTNARIGTLLDEIMDRPESERPIVLLQADEGPYPFRWKQSKWKPNKTPDEIREKFRILNAYYLPGVSDAELYPSISPVNSFRVVLNAYFGTELDLLPDRSYIFPPDKKRRYSFEDVTEIVRGR